MSELTALLEVANITYTSRVSERTGTASKLFNNPEKSFSLQVAWMIFISIIIAIAFSGPSGSNLDLSFSRRRAKRR
jgi:hypothetical protein